MKLVAPSTIITALELEELRLLTDLTEVNSCCMYIKLIWHAFFFSADFIIDWVLFGLYLSRGEVWEAIAIIVLMIISAGVTSIYYWWNEKWIDNDQGHSQGVRPCEGQEDGDVEAGPGEPLYKPEEIGLIEISLSSNLNDSGNDDPTPSCSYSSPTVEISPTKSKSNGVSSDSRENISDSCRRVRCCTRWIGISPIFRAYYLIRVLLGKHFEVVKRQRSGRQALSEEELKSLDVIHESQIVQASFSMIETSFEALPQILLQIFLAAVATKLELMPSRIGDYMIYGSIIWCLISAAISLTTYQGAYYLLYVKLARIKDKLYLGGDIPPKALTPISWLTTFATFGFHLAILVGRVYGFANILVTYGLGAFLLFIVFLFITQLFWLESPNQRMVFENPTRGITTTCSNLVDRFTNLFSFHQIRPTLKSLGAYHIIFMFWFLLFSKMADLVIDMLNLDEGNNGKNCSLSDNGTLAMNISGGNSSDNGTSGTNVPTSPDMTLLEVVANQNIVIITWTVSFAASLLYLFFRTKVDKFLREKYFPVLKALELWGELTGSRMRDLSVKHKRALCLFIMATDDELRKVLDDKCPCCFRQSGSDDERVDSKVFNDVWDKFTQQYNFKRLLRLDNIEGEERQAVQEGWERLKTVKRGKSASLVVKFNYVLKLNEMIDPLFEDSTVEVKDLYPFLHFYDYFEDYLSKLNSSRLGRMFILLGEDGENRSTLKCIWQR